MLENLRQRLAERMRRNLQRPGEAAVLVPIVNDGGPLRLLLTRRAAHLASHAGQVAFPGGAMDPSDDSPVATALREAAEEIALPPDRVEVLGLLDDFPTVTNQVVVTPVVGWIRELPPLRSDPGEVAAIFSIPFDALREPSGWIVQRVHRDGREWPLYFFEWSGETLWGLTAYIVLHLMDLLPIGPPFPLPQIELK